MPSQVKDSDIELQNIPKHDGSDSTSPYVLSAQNATFAWSLSSPPTVKDVTFDIMRGKLTVLVGPVGSGKSTLLKGLLGETPSSQGFVYVDSMQCALVEQTSWIQNETIRNNIIGICNYEEPWYTTVVQACALDKDIAQMPKNHASKQSRLFPCARLICS